MIEKIALITGGDSAEREVALNTASSIEKSLLEMGLSYELIMADKDMPSRLLEQDFSLAFLALHGGRGEDGSLQGFCEVLGIPYTGSGVFSSAICMNKTASKAFLKEAGLDTPKWQNLESPKDLALDFPLVIKPVYGGSSVATSVLRSSKGLEEAFEAAKREYGSSVMAEEYIPGREITVGVIDGEPLPAL
ncbi:MAG: ATP-grasp domain-containing protein, partial [Elusimicrobia bacterium]|nr:ATP-grasp domain-containing protein [Elusimicrobiota bacterium]